MTSEFLKRPDHKRILEKQERVDVGSKDEATEDILQLDDSDSCDEDDKRRGRMLFKEMRDYDCLFCKPQKSDYVQRT